MLRSIYSPSALSAPSDPPPTTHGTARVCVCVCACVFSLDVLVIICRQPQGGIVIVLLLGF